MKAIKTLNDLHEVVTQLKAAHTTAAERVLATVVSAAEAVRGTGLDIRHPVILRAYFAPVHQKPILRRESAQSIVAMIPGHAGTVRVEEGELPELFPGDLKDLRRQVEHVESVLAVVEQVGDNLPLLIAGAMDTWPPEEDV